MNRRGFLRGLAGGVAATAAVRTFPFRVFSFPTEIVKPESYATYVMGRNSTLGPAEIIYYDKEAIDRLKNFYFKEATRFRPVTMRMRFFSYGRANNLLWTKSMTPGLPGTGGLTAR